MPDQHPLLPTRSIAQLPVTNISLGCMNLSHAYGHPPDTKQALGLLHAAVEAGITMLDTAALYGFGSNEILLGKFLKQSQYRNRITLASKGGMKGVADAEGVMRRVIDGKAQTLRQDCEDSLKRLDTETIDLYYLHRWDKSVPIEESVGELAHLVQEGKIRAIGLSEVSTDTLKRAHAVHPIAALQSEYSLWSRNAELGTLQACEELGIAFVAFSPLARAFLTGTLREVGSLPPKDIRRSMPRFSPEAYAQNLELLESMQKIAQRNGCTLAQLALAWVLHQGEHVIALPGTTCIEHLTENLGAARLHLQAADLAELSAIFQPQNIIGARYPINAQNDVDTEKFAFEM